MRPKGRNHGPGDHRPRASHAGWPQVGHAGRRGGPGAPNPVLAGFYSFRKKLKGAQGARVGEWCLNGEYGATSRRTRGQ